MALFTRLREVRGDVIRIRRSLKIFQVTADAGCDRQIVVIVHMALGALPRRNCVHACERERCRVMVERSIRPRRGVMALLTGLRELRRNVIRIGRALIVLQMAAYASYAR